MANMFAYTHIPQPPHSAGQSFQGLRAHIEPHQIPSVAEAVEADKENWNGQTFMTLPGKHVPLSTTDYVSIDQGNSSPRFIRVSTWNLPSTSNLAHDCEIPLVAVIQPFADLDPQEEAIPIVDTGKIGPARCEQCRGYINPWCRWVAGGNLWKCNLCSHENEVVPEYFCNLDANLMRLDHAQRPELNKGTVDFIVPEDYWAAHPPSRLSPSYLPLEPTPTGTRKPQPMDYVFVFDISHESIRSGFLDAACSALLHLLYGGVDGDNSPVEPCFPSGNRLAVLTFDRTLHFYDLSSTLNDAPMIVLPDLEEIFLPLKEGLFIDPIKHRTTVENLLNALPSRHADTQLRDSALGAALSGVLALLAGRGGNVVVFQSTLPNCGPGALHANLDESKLYETDKEHTLFIPRHEFWRDVAEECAEEGIGVNMFLGMSQFIDIGSIGAVSSLTGGELYFHPRFDHSRDSIPMSSQLSRLISRTTAYNCMMRVRSSNGLRIATHMGNFYQRTVTDLEFGTIDADKSITVRLEHSRALDEREYAFLQAALLYTTASGQRRVRTCNLALQVAALAGNVFRFADMDTVVTYMIREAISAMPSQRLTLIRDEMTHHCSAILLGYRRNCAAATAPTQLILPEAFRTLPVYTLAILKSKPLKGRNVSADVRNYYAHKLLFMSVRSVMQHLYPRMLAIHDLDDTIALPDPSTGAIRLPSPMRLSHIYMQGHGIYFIDNEEMIVIWVGSSASPQLLHDLFGADDIMNVDPFLHKLPVLESRLSAQIRNITTSRYLQRGYTPKLFVARQNMDGSELEFSDMLVEDQNNAALSYIDYLCLIHKRIHTALTNGGVMSGTASLHGSPW